MSEYKISVIIPFYNVKTYIKNCIENILNQTLQDIEIIAVNDGSTDGSDAIVRAYSNIKIIDKENGGASSARNAGLSVATGKYIYFMDSDDSIETFTLQMLYDVMESEDLDQAVMSPDNYMERNRDELQRIWQEDYSDVMTGKELFTKYVRNVHFCSGPPFRMIRRQIIEENHLRFQEGIIFEDELFTFQLLMLCNRVKMLNKRMYYVTKRPDSVTASTDDVRRFLSYQTIVKLLASMSCWHSTSKEERDAVNRYMTERFNECMEYYHHLTKEHKKSYKQQYRAAQKAAEKCGYYNNWKIKLMCRFPGAYGIYYQLMGK